MIEAMLTMILVLGLNPTTCYSNLSEDVTVLNEECYSKEEETDFAQQQDYYEA